MNTQVRTLTLAFATLTTQFTPAQTPAQPTKPSNATGQCKDGSYSTASGKDGACRGHNGVKEWYTAPTSPAPKAAPTPTTAQQPTTNTPQPADATRKGPKANLASTPAAPGGAPNLVWVNTSSNVYHCYGTDFYGKTKAGAYMTEADAKTKGAHGNRGATCTK